MTVRVTVEEAQVKLKGLLAMMRDGDEISIEENGEEIGKLLPKGARRSKPAKREFGRGTKKGYFMLPDFDSELPDSFWLGEQE